MFRNKRKVKFIGTKCWIIVWYRNDYGAMNNSRVDGKYVETIDFYIPITNLKKFVPLNGTPGLSNIHHTIRLTVLGDNPERNTIGFHWYRYLVNMGRRPIEILNQDISVKKGGVVKIPVRRRIEWKDKL